MILSLDPNLPKYYPWRLCRHVYGAAWKWGMWMRVYGVGPHIAKGRGIYFSERYGHRRIIRIGGWSFEWLRNPASTRTET